MTAVDDLALVDVDWSELADAIQEEVETLALPDGTYLGIVQAVESKVGSRNNSVGWSWKLRLNSDNEQLTDWNPAAKQVTVYYYTFLGYLENGQLVFRGKDGKPGRPGFTAVNMLKALGFRNGQLDKQDALGRQVLVTVAAEADYRETNEGVPAEFASKILTVKSVRPFIFEGEIATKLPGYEKLNAADELKAPEGVDDIAF